MPAIFEAHVGGFAGAGDGDAPGPFGGDAEEEIDGLEEGVVESAGDEFEAGRLGAEDTAGVVEPAVPPGRRFGQVDLQGHQRLHARSDADPGLLPDPPATIAEVGGNTTAPPGSRSG